MKFWAVLGSRGCREKKLPTAISMQLFGVVFSTHTNQNEFTTMYSACRIIKCMFAEACFDPHILNNCKQNEIEKEVTVIYYIQSLLLGALMSCL